MSAEHLTTKQAAERAGVSRFALLRAQKSGDLFAVKDNRGRWLWDADSLDAWAAERPDNQDKAAPTSDKSGGDALALAQALGEARGLAEGLRVALSQAQQEATTWREEAQAQRARADALAGRSWLPWRK